MSNLIRFNIQLSTHVVSVNLVIIYWQFEFHNRTVLILPLLSDEFDMRDKYIIALLNRHSTSLLDGNFISRS